MKFNMRPRYWCSKAEEAVAINGITRERALAFNSPSAVVPRIFQFIKEIPGQEHFVCHANRVAGTFGCFDRQILQSCFLDAFLANEGANHFIIDEKLPVSKVISTHTLAKNKLKLDNYKLSTVCDHLGIKLNHHDAVSDCEAAAEILRRLYDEEGQKFITEELYGRQTDPQGTSGPGKEAKRSRKSKSYYDFAY